MNTEGTNNKPLKKGGEEMTKEEIKRILGKKKWTGVEVGRLLLNSTTISTVMESEQDREMIVPYSTIEKMAATLPPRAYENYRTYVLISMWAGEERNNALQKKYFTQLRSEEVVHPLVEFETADMIERCIQHMPVVMTEKQYQAERNRRIADVVNQANNSSYTVGDLMLMGISYYLESPTGKEKQAQVFSAESLEEIADFNKKYSSLKAMGIDVDEDLQHGPNASTMSVLLFGTQYSHIAEDVRQDLGSYFPEIMNLTKEEWGTKTYTGYQIVQRNYMEGASLLEDSRLFLTNRRAVQNGIAILKPGIDRGNINRNGGYISGYWDLKKIAGQLSIDFYNPEAGDKGAHQAMKEARQEFGASLYWLDAYNVVLNAIADVYKVPALKRFRINTAPILKRVNFYNHNVDMIENWFNAETYSTAADREMKINTLHDVFPVINDSEIIVSEQKAKAIYAMIKDPGTFRQHYKIMNYAGFKSPDSK